MKNPPKTQITNCKAVYIDGFAVFTFNNDNADFFIQLKGNNAGRPLFECIPNSVGVEVNRDFFYPKFLYYLFLNLFNSEQFRPYIKGSVIPYIRQDDIYQVVFAWFIKNLA